VPAIPPLKTREPRLLAVRDAAEARLVGLIAASQHVLSDAAVEGGIRRERRPEVLQLGLLLGAREGDVAALPGGAALFQGGVGEQQMVQRQRADHHHQTALALVRRYDTISLEDLQVRTMVQNRCLAKSISDAGWASFRTILGAKAAWPGAG
jgi:IS605 OrfB family transposase